MRNIFLCLSACLGSFAVACSSAEGAPTVAGPLVQHEMAQPPAAETAIIAGAAPADAPAAGAPAPVAPSASAEQTPGALPIAPAPGADAVSPPGNAGAMGEPAAAGDPPPAVTDPPPAVTDPAPRTPPDELPPITVWIAGDSTVANGNTPCPRGWGGVFAPAFGSRVTVRNSAVGGRSVHTWLYDVQTELDATGECTLGRDANGAPVLQGRWQEMLDGMKAGDYLLIQFGINDGDRTCPRHVGIEAFKASYAMMALAAKERGAQAVFLTPVSSISCIGDQARGSRGGFVPATVEIGAELGVPVIDLHARSVELFQSLAFCPVAGGDVSAATTGPVGDFFCDDHTHFSPEGAVEISDLVVQALRDQSIPLAEYLR
jgi:lysophospholipase L1-like esterase